MPTSTQFLSYISSQYLYKHILWAFFKMGTFLLWLGIRKLWHCTGILASPLSIRPRWFRRLHSWWAQYISLLCCKYNSFDSSQHLFYCINLLHTFSLDEQIHIFSNQILHRFEMLSFEEKVWSNSFISNAQRTRKSMHCWWDMYET